MPHAVVSSLFPRDFYAALLLGIPPTELFGDEARNKQHVNVPLTVAPMYSRRVWNFLIYKVQSVLRRAVVKKFREPLGGWIATHWPALAPDPFAPPMKLGIAGRSHHAARARIPHCAAS